MNSEISVLGNRIRSLREDQDLTQKELSTMIGLTPKMISFYENNQRTPPIDILLKISRIFDVDINYLVGLSSSKNAQVSAKNISPQELNLLQYYRKVKKVNEHTECKYGSIEKYFPNAQFLSPEEKELLNYYNELSLKDKRWIMGQMIDLIKKQEESVNPPGKRSDYRFYNEESYSLKIVPNFGTLYFATD